MELIKWEKARFEKNSLIIDETVSIDEWKQLGQGLRQIEGCVQFWIGDWARFGDKKGFTGKYTDRKVYDELEKITGIERQTLLNYKSVAEKTSEIRQNPTDVSRISFSHFQEVAKLSPEKQEIFLQKASEEKLSVRELRNEIKKEEKEYKIMNMPPGSFRVIYADPPWSYNDKCEDGAIQSGGAEKHYPTMTISDLCNMQLPEIAEDAVLFLWTTSPLLEESFDVINAWGFKYKASFIWDKVKHNMGHYNSVRHEFLLVCTKGSCTPDNLKLFDSVQSIEKTDKHSQKPHEFREIIKTLYPSGNAIELFAREKHEGWEVWGNEL